MMLPGRLTFRKLRFYMTVNTRVYSLRQFNAALKKSGLRIISGMTLGFGPFSFFKYPLFSDRLAIRLHRMIQDVADQGTPILRHAGHVYAVLAEKATGD